MKIAKRLNADGVETSSAYLSRRGIRLPQGYQTVIEGDGAWKSSGVIGGKRCILLTPHRYSGGSIDMAPSLLPSEE